MRLSLYHDDPDTDAKPHMQDYEVALKTAESHNMLLDALIRLKEQDDTFAFPALLPRRRVRIQHMNINGKNGLACITGSPTSQGTGGGAA